MFRSTQTLSTHGVLARAPWFATLSVALRGALLAEADVRQLRAGQWLYGTGDPPQGLYAVLDGAALVHVPLPSGDDALVHVALPGELFGQAAQLGRGPRLATVMAAQRSSFLQLSDRALMAVAADYPELWERLAQLLYQQLGATLQGYARLLRQAPATRLAWRLWQLSHGAPGARVPLSQTQLAELIGVTRKTCNGLLAELAAEGIVVPGYRALRVLDPQALWQRAQQ